MSTALLVWLVSATVQTGSIDDPYVGNVMCVRCHEEYQNGFAEAPHGDDESAVEIVEQGCQSCHGPGRAHVQQPEQEDRRPNTARYNIAEKNELCQSCHDELAPYSKHHPFADMSCSQCHVLHSPVYTEKQKETAEQLGEELPELPAPVSGILAWQTSCIDCHTDDETDFDELHAYDAENLTKGLVSCKSCHLRPPHGIEQSPAGP